jgi:hypothetical protein
MMQFLQYHNGACLGWVPLDARPFQQSRPSIWTRRPGVRKAVGGVVYLIVSLPRPKRYYLWERFQIAEVRQEGDDFCAWGPGWQLTPPQPLEGEAFARFRKACAHFVGFRRIDHLPYAATLEDLARRHQQKRPDPEVERFCDDLVAALPRSGDARYARGFVRRQLGRHAEAVADFDEALRLRTEFAAEAEALRQLPGGAAMPSTSPSSTQAGS